MDLMAIRRGLMMNVGEVRMASGEFVLESNAQTVEITHNLHSDKVIFIAQRVNADHSIVSDDGSRYRNIAFFAVTKQALEWDLLQPYTFDSGTEQHFITTGSANSYPTGTFTYFGAKTDAFPFPSSIVRPDIGVIVQTNDTVIIQAIYPFLKGRWVWRAYKIG